MLQYLVIVSAQIVIMTTEVFRNMLYGTNLGSVADNLKDVKYVVLDEVQNLDHRQGSPLEKMLREGRKFGVSLILATQTLSNLKKEEQA